MRVQLVGFDQVLQAVRNLPDKMKVKAMKGIMQKNMKPIAAGIRSVTPKSDLKDRIKKNRKGQNVKDKRGNNVILKAGNLQKSIGTRAFSKGTDVSAYAGINKKGRYDGYYGFFIARGTKHISKDDFISRGANPKIGTAANNLSNDINEYIAKNARQLGLNASVR